MNTLQNKGKKRRTEHIFFPKITGKSEHIWDRFSHDGKNWHNDTGDIACDSYHKYKEDIQLVRSLGVRTYM